MLCRGVGLGLEIRELRSGDGVEVDCRRTVCFELRGVTMWKFLTKGNACVHVHAGHGDDEKGEKDGLHLRFNQ